MEFPRQNVLLPEGVYELIVEDAKEGKSSGGYDQIELRLKVIDGEYEGRALFDYWVLIAPGPDTKGTFWKVEQNLQAMAEDRFFSNKVVNFDPPDLVGLVCKAVVVQDDNTKGRIVNKIDRYLNKQDAVEENVPF